jgi:hypothetical protein
VNDHNNHDDGRESRILLFLTIVYGAAVSAHSIAMSTTIIVEVAAASALLICVGYSCRNAMIGSTRLARRAGM